VRRGATDLRLVVEAGGAEEAKDVASWFSCPADAICTIAGSWDEVMSCLRAVSAEVASRAPLDQAMGTMTNVAAQLQAAPPRTVPMSEVAQARPAISMTQVNGGAQTGTGLPFVFQFSQTDMNPWTLIWISDQAFKPAATALKTQLEALGGQVKGYKTHKNAARALDKKRALARTVVLVAGPEAAPFLAYLGSRPELANTRVVVEANSRSVPIREGPFVEVADSFEGSLMAVQRIVNEPTFS